MNRTDLEQKADHLGIAWTEYTSDEELCSLILATEQLLANAPVDDELDYSTAAECLGLFWDHPGEETCQSCPGHKRCFAKFLEGRFLEAAKDAGPDPDISKLAKHLDVSMQAVKVALDFAQRSGRLEPVVIDPPPEIPQAPESEVGAEEKGPEVVEPTRKKRGRPPKARAAAEEVPKAEAKKKRPAKEPVPPVTKAPAKRGRPRKQPLSDAADVIVRSGEKQNPSVAESVKPAKGSAKKRPAKFAPPAKELAGQSKPKRWEGHRSPKQPRDPNGFVENPWGRHTWRARWLRERQHPLIAKLRSGMKIQRLYGGETHEVEVLPRFYRYKGQDYPTLYAVVKEIAGTKPAPKQTRLGTRPTGTRDLCDWSAPKFFNLRVLFR